MITIRQADPDDAPVIIEFQKRMALETENLTLEDDKITPGVYAVFEQPARGKYFVASDGEKVVASLLITPEWSDWRNTEVWWFQSVYVMPGYRGKGIFRKMYSYIRDLVIKENVAGLRLYVEQNNLIARRTYEAMGMTSEHYTLYEWLREY